MTVTVDDRRRVRLPDCEPGDRFDCQRDSQGQIVLRHLQISSDQKGKKARLVKLKRAKDGRLYVPQVRVSRELVARLIREERDSR